MKVLIVDDDESIISSLTRLASLFKDVVVIQCHEVTQVIDAVEKEEPDAVILDHSLTHGGKEGLIAAKEISTRYGNKVKLISNSAALTFEEEQEYQELEAEMLNKRADKLMGFLENNCQRA